MLSFLLVGTPYVAQADPTAGQVLGSIPADYAAVRMDTQANFNADLPKDGEFIIQVGNQYLQAVTNAGNWASPTLTSDPSVATKFRSYDAGVFTSGAVTVQPYIAPWATNGGLVSDGNNKICWIGIATDGTNSWQRRLGTNFLGFTFKSNNKVYTHGNKFIGTNWAPTANETLGLNMRMLLTPAQQQALPLAKTNAKASLAAATAAVKALLFPADKANFTLSTAEAIEATTTVDGANAIKTSMDAITTQATGLLSQERALQNSTLSALSTVTGAQAFTGLWMPDQVSILMGTGILQGGWPVSLSVAISLITSAIRNGANGGSLAAWRTALNTAAAKATMYSALNTVTTAAAFTSLTLANQQTVLQTALGGAAGWPSGIQISGATDLPTTLTNIKKAINAATDATILNGWAAAFVDTSALAQGAANSGATTTSVLPAAGSTAVEAKPPAQIAIQ